MNSRAKRNERRWKRLISLREHDERRERASLAEARHELTHLSDERDALLEHRGVAEAEASSSPASESEALRDQYAHLLKLNLLLERNELQQIEAEERFREREQAWLETRRAVKSLETLLERQDARAKEHSERENDKLVETLTALKHNVREDERI